MDNVRMISHWHQFFDQTQHSPQALFTAVDAALAKRKIPDAKASRVEFAEGAALGGKREYLRVARKGYTFDVCAAPFGSGFFVSWWFSKVSRRGLLYAAIATVVVFAIVGLLIKVAGFFLGTFFAIIAVPALFLGLGYAVRRGAIGIEQEVLSVPVLGALYNWIFKPFGYYQIDTERSFEKAVHAAVLEAVDELTAAKGIRALSEVERKPIHRELAKR